MPGSGLFICLVQVDDEASLGGVRAIRKPVWHRRLGESAGHKNNGILVPLSSVDGHDSDLRAFRLDRLQVALLIAVQSLSSLVEHVDQPDQVQALSVSGLL